MKQFWPAFSFIFFLSASATAQTAKQTFSHLDTLFGSNTPQRSWWDVQRYDVSVTPDIDTKTISGRTTLTYSVLTDQHDDYLQVDLQQPLEIDSIFYNGKRYVSDPARPIYSAGGHWFISLPQAAKGTTQQLTIVYHGKPKEAHNPPWEGGWVWKKDKQGRTWVSVACEDDGASLWYPCKDMWSDEPDKGASLTINVPEELAAVGNGRLKQRVVADGKASYTWEVTAPINAYNIIPYIGHYVSWTDTLSGEKGKLDLAYWVLDYEKTKAEKQFEQVKPMFRAFEHWFGPYPFYTDGYKLVQSPYLGMEHQSAVAYGNGFMNGYLGTDLSGTGWGLKWDYIIVHESGHEWFGNNITAKDIADMWVHEGFTDYSETLFTEYYYGKNAGNDYTQGLRKGIANDKPIIGPYGVHKPGSDDQYNKGSNVLHTIRQIINDDEKFRQILRGLNETFYHQTVTTKQVEDYISQKSGRDLRNVFDQYLRTTKVPTLEYKRSGKTVRYRWANAIKGFDMPVRLTNGDLIGPTENWKTLTLPNTVQFDVDKNFYINLRKL
ncbi:M1 family metallopeptidase [Flavisolibacter nicotianae]|uniref:M1 family metallopeptidase n=1 Tax=Flavisolibacter nicotianae TaxID=2364882 RepID=UPI000EB2D10E|nr:M1 family metallopeptidase [Flavisolibacter nicotianae]